MKIVLIFTLILVAQAVRAQAIDPGKWHAVSRFRVDGLPLPDSVGEDCVTPDEAKDARASVTKGLDKIGCVITAWNMTANHLQATLSCKNSDVDASGSVEGDFSDKAYHLEGRAHGFYKKILPSVASITLDGTWLSECN